MAWAHALSGWLAELGSSFSGQLRCLDSAAIEVDALNSLAQRVHEGGAGH